MIQKLKNMRDGFKTIKDLEKQISALNESGIDFSDSKKLLESLGVDIEELDKHFEDSFDKTITLEYSYKSVNPEPTYAYPTDSGFDLRANEVVHFKPFERKLVPTGLFVNIPDGYEIQVRPKSGLAINQGLTVLNTPGTVDSGYDGEVKVILYNSTQNTIEIIKGQKIAQACVCPVVNGRWLNPIEVNEITDKDRGSNGFGSTGI